MRSLIIDTCYTYFHRCPWGGGGSTHSVFSDLEVDDPTGEKICYETNRNKYNNNNNNNNRK